MTFEETISDLDQLIGKYQLQKVSLLGHSFGGIVSTLYAQACPGKVERLILIGALFSQQESYDHILQTIGKLAIAKIDTVSIRQISLIRRMDSGSADYRKQIYGLASDYGYFDMTEPTKESVQLRSAYLASDFGKNNVRNDQAPLLFYTNEKKVSLNIKPVLKDLQEKKIKLFGIYGKDDRIFSAKQITDISKIVGITHFDLIENCSHYPFVDQQRLFIADVVKFMHMK